MSLTLIFGKPLLISKECDVYVYQPTWDDIETIGDKAFEQYITPYIITMKALFVNSEKSIEMMNKFHMFDFFFERVDDNGYQLDGYFKMNTVELLVDSLKFFLKEDDIEVLESRRKLIVKKADGREFMITDGVFDEIRKAVQAVTMKSDIEPKKEADLERINENEKFRRDYENRQSKNKKSDLAGVINMVALGGDSFIDYEVLRKKTYYQVMIMYSSISAKASYNHLIKYETSDKFKLKKSVEHWIDDVMLKEKKK